MVGGGNFLLWSNLLLYIAIHNAKACGSIKTMHSLHNHLNINIIKNVE